MANVLNVANIYTSSRYGAILALIGSHVCVHLIKAFKICFWSLQNPEGNIWLQLQKFVVHLITTNFVCPLVLSM